MSWLSYIQGPTPVQWGCFEAVCQVQRAGCCGNGHRRCFSYMNMAGPPSWSKKALVVRLSKMSTWSWNPEARELLFCIYYFCIQIQIQGTKRDLIQKMPTCLSQARTRFSIWFGFYLMKTIKNRSTKRFLMRPRSLEWTELFMRGRWK